MYSIYTVRPGDTFFSIANNHGTTIAELYRLNNLRYGHVLRSGEQLIVPSLEPQNYNFYQIRFGDTLSSIGRMFNVSPRVIAEVNEIDINHIIRPNEVLRIPKQTAETFTTNELMGGTTINQNNMYSGYNANRFNYYPQTDIY